MVHGASYNRNLSSVNYIPIQLLPDAEIFKTRRKQTYVAHWSVLDGVVKVRKCYTGLCGGLNSVRCQGAKLVKDAKSKRAAVYDRNKNGRNRLNWRRVLTSYLYQLKMDSPIFFKALSLLLQSLEVFCVPHISSSLGDHISIWSHFRKFVRHT